MKMLSVLHCLINNPGYHYDLDIVEATKVSRSMIYVYLKNLEIAGLVIRQDGYKLPEGYESRPMYMSAVGFKETKL